MYSVLTGLVKHRAFGMGSDLVGIANIERFANAPLMMSPQGILPEARSVVVCALHHPDGCIEIGGQEHPQIIGAYNVQYQMNMHLDHISYEMARFLEDEGYEAIPIASSNIWRYRGYKDLSSTFAPDMSHIYAAVTAGLSELGWHGISMTPEFGTRNRFVSIITTAPLSPTPLQPGNTLCDRCMECAEHCLSGALSEEIPGTEDLVIEDRRYTKAIKNLWRCSWGEHFGVDLDLPKPEQVTEENIMATIEEHGLRGGEMGSCLRHCLPPHLREWDRDYTSAPRRKRPFLPTGDVLPRQVQDKLVATAMAAGVDEVRFYDEPMLQAEDPNYKQCLPEATHRVDFGVRYPTGSTGGQVAHGAQYIALTQAYLGARQVEDLGYRVVTGINAKVEPREDGWQAITAHFYTDAPLVATANHERAQGSAPTTAPAGPNLTRSLKKAAAAMGCDQVGIASPARIADLKRQLAPLMDGEETLVAVNRGKTWMQWEPEVTVEQRRLKDAADYLPSAQAVVMLGLRIPSATVRRTAQPPAEAVGPYIFAQYVVNWILREKALFLVKWLRERGYQAEVTLDLMGTGSIVANPRGPQTSVFANRFEAVAAGLGTLTKGGFVTTADFGTNIRYLAVITDAPLTADALPDLQALRGECASCALCQEVCPSQAYTDPVTVTLEGQELTFHRLDQKRCDWVARYALMGDDGFKFLGGRSNVPAPAEITPEALAEGLKQLDVVQHHHRCGVESCVVKCPLSAS